MSARELQPIGARILMQGAASVSTVELLAVVLGSAGVARSLHRTFERWWELGPSEIKATPRFTPARAAQVLAVVELSRRIHGKPLKRGASLCCSEDVAAAYSSRLRDHKQEVFIVLALDARNRVIAEHEVARGTLTSVDVHPREVFRPLIRSGAAGAIAVHNHPSGDASPSTDDQALCSRLCRAGEMLGIPLLDFVVIGHGTHVSFADSGTLGTWR